MNEKGSGLIPLLIGAFIALSIIGGIYYISIHNDPYLPEEAIKNESSYKEEEIPLQINETKNWEIYSDKELGIQFKYPPEWHFISGIGDTGNAAIGSRDISNYEEIWVIDTEHEKKIDKEIKILKGEEILEDHRSLEDGENIEKALVVNLKNSKGLIKIECVPYNLKESPVYSIEFINNEQQISIEVSDPKTNNISIEECRSYVSQITLPNSESNDEYLTYNSFIKLIETIEF